MICDANGKSLDEAEAVRQMAQSAGIDSVALIRQWVVEKTDHDFDAMGGACYNDLLC